MLPGFLLYSKYIFKWIKTKNQSYKSLLQPLWFKEAFLSHQPQNSAVSGVKQTESFLVFLTGCGCWTPYKICQSLPSLSTAFVVISQKEHHILAEVSAALSGVHYILFVHLRILILFSSTASFCWLQLSLPYKSCIIFLCLNRFSPFPLMHYYFLNIYANFKLISPANAEPQFHPPGC